MTKKTCKHAVLAKVQNQQEQYIILKCHMRTKRKNGNHVRDATQQTVETWLELTEGHQTGTELTAGDFKVDLCGGAGHKNAMAGKEMLAQMHIIDNWADKPSRTTSTWDGGRGNKKCSARLL